MADVHMCWVMHISVWHMCFVLYYVLWIHPHPLLLPSTSFTPPLHILHPSSPYPSPLPSPSFSPLLHIFPPLLLPSPPHPSPLSSPSFTPQHPSPLHSPLWALQVDFTTFLTMTLRQRKISKRLVCQPLGHEGSSR